MSKQYKSLWCTVLPVLICPAAGGAQVDHSVAAEVQGGLGYHHCKLCQPLGVSQLCSLPG